MKGGTRALGRWGDTGVKGTERLSLWEHQNPEKRACLGPSTGHTGPGFVPFTLAGAPPACPPGGPG